MSSSREAYLIQGIRGIGKTEFGRRKAEESGGVCLSIEDFFYKIVDHKNPETYSLRTDRYVSSRRWFWIQLKQLCENGISPIYIDQQHKWSRQSINTAGFLDTRYDYYVDLIQPDSEIWNRVRMCLVDKKQHYQELFDLACKIVAKSKHNLTVPQVLKDMDEYKEFTVQDLLSKY